MTVRADNESREPITWGKVIDNRKCIGCHACTVACKQEHDVPLGVNRTYVKQVEVGRYPNVRRHFQVTRCNQCADAPCVEICPTTAMYQRPDGIVDFDRTRCIGCQACMAACPYDAIYIDPVSHSAEKCNFCTNRPRTTTRLRNGLPYAGDFCWEPRRPNVERLEPHCQGEGRGASAREEHQPEAILRRRNRPDARPDGGGVQRLFQPVAANRHAGRSRQAIVQRRQRPVVQPRSRHSRVRQPASRAVELDRLGVHMDEIDLSGARDGRCGVRTSQLRPKVRGARNQRGADGCRYRRPPACDHGRAARARPASP